MKKEKKKELKKLEDTKRFKGGRFRSGDVAMRIMEEDGKLFRTKCIVAKITRRYIVCEIMVAGGKGNVSKLVNFDKKTGIHEEGRCKGWLKNPPKPKRMEALSISTHVKTNNDTGGIHEESREISYIYC